MSRTSRSPVQNLNSEPRMDTPGRRAPLKKAFPARQTQGAGGWPTELFDRAHLVLVVVFLLEAFAHEDREDRLEAAGVDAVLAAERVVRQQVVQHLDRALPAVLLLADDHQHQLDALRLPKLRLVHGLHQRRAQALEDVLAELPLVLAGRITLLVRRRRHQQRVHPLRPLQRLLHAL